MPRKSQRSQLSQSQPGRSQQTEESLTEVNLNIDEQVNDLVRYIINRAGEHTIFKRSEFKKNVLYKAGPNFQTIINQATTILKEVYGYNVLVVDAAQNLTKSYVISNGLAYLPDPTEELEEGQPPEDVHKILLLLILCHIFMSNNSVSEGMLNEDLPRFVMATKKLDTPYFQIQSYLFLASLYSFLNSFNIDVERRHELFGNVKDYIIHTLKNKKYIEVEMDQISKRVSFSWGPRAEKEISKHDILNFVCKMYKDRQPASWIKQFSVANEQQFENIKIGPPVTLNIEQEND